MLISIYFRKLQYILPFGYSCHKRVKAEQKPAKPPISFQTFFAFTCSFFSDVDIFLHLADCQTTVSNNFFSCTPHSFSSPLPPAWHIIRVSSFGRKTKVQIVLFYSQVSRLSLSIDNLWQSIESNKQTVEYMCFSCSNISAYFHS